MRWRPDPEHTASWSAVGGVMVLVGAAAAPYVPTTLALYGCVAFALIGFYVMLGPLLPLPPWRRSLGMNGLLAREWRRAKRRRLWRRVFHRPPPEPDRIPADGFVPDASTVSDRAENFGEKITAETMQIIGAETPPPPRIVQQDRQAEVKTLVGARRSFGDTDTRGAISLLPVPDPLAHCDDASGPNGRGRGLGY